MPPGCLRGTEPALPAQHAAALVRFRTNRPPPAPPRSAALTIYRIMYFGQRLLLMNENADQIAVNTILCNIFYVQCVIIIQSLVVAAAVAVCFAIIICSAHLIFQSQTALLHSKTIE